MTGQSTALVVGASRGLGFALAEEWLGRGWRVIATARGRSDQLETLANRFPDSRSTSTMEARSARCASA